MKWTVSERMMQAGRHLVEDERIIDISPIVDQFIWQADVLEDKIYHVTLDGTTKEQDHCTCEEWRKSHYCRHTIACELWLQQQHVSRIIDPSIDYTEMFRTTSISHTMIQRFKVLEEKQLTLTTEAYQPLKLDATVIFVSQSSLSYFGLQLRIAIDQPHARYSTVKDIQAFLDAYRRQDTYTVGSHAFLLNEAYFSLEDRILLDRLLVLDDSAQLMNIHEMWWDKRLLLITPDHLRRLCEWLESQQRLTVQFGDECYHHLTFTNDIIDMTCMLSLDTEGLTMSFSSLETLNYYHRYGCVRIENTMYMLTQYQQQIIANLYEVYVQHRQTSIQYQSSQIEDVLTYIIPAFRQCMHIQMDTVLQQNIIDEPLHINMYLKKIPGHVILRVDACYGDAIISSDPACTVHNTQQYINRDMHKELALQQAIIHLGYQKMASNYVKAMPSDAEQLYRFFTDEYDILHQYGDVFMEDILQQQQLQLEQDDVAIHVEEKHGWLSVHFDISDISQQEVSHILTHIKRHIPFYQLDNGQLLRLDNEAFQHTSQALVALKDAAIQSNGDIRLPNYRAMQVDNIMQTSTYYKQETTFKQFTMDLAHPSQFDVDIPQALQATLRPYQEDGFRWLCMLSHYGLAGVLADDMGLGKTVQTIAYILAQKEKNPTFRVLVVAPASLIYNWQSEVKRFAPILDVTVVHGTKQQRLKQLASATKDTIVITSYASLRQDQYDYQDESFDTLILDEAQMIKNATTKTFAVIQSLPIQQRFALSGTPIENHLDELWALFQTIMPGFFPPLQQFKQLPLSRVSMMIQPFILRRQKEIVLQELPKKTETLMYSSLTTKQKEIYMAYLSQLRQQVNNMDHRTFQQNSLNILSGLTRLRQICCTPALFIDDFDERSGKMQQVCDLLQQAKQSQRRVLLFSQFTHMLDILEPLIQQLGLQTFYLKGSTSPDERQRMVDAFNSGERDVFLISLKAGGTGLNLTGADTVILFDLWWNPAMEAQAMGRAHRIGQHKHVEVWRLIAEGTIEEKMNALQEEKKALVDTVLNPDVGHIDTHLTEQDIRDILN